MNDTRLLKLIKTFSKEELKSFEKFLQSPFLKPARDTSKLYSYIIKNYPDYEASKLEKEKVFRKLFTGESYNEKKLLNLIFDLTKAAEDFLALNTIMNDEVEFLLSLSKGYSEKNLTNESNRINKLIEKKLKHGLSPGKDYISKFRRLNYLKSIFFTENHDYENNIAGKKKYFEESALQFIIDYTEIVGSIATAMNTYGINIKSKFIDSVIQNFDLEKMMDTLDKSEFEKKHLIFLQYYILKMNLEPENKLYFEMLRDSFYELLPTFEREDKCLIFNQLANHCMRMNNKEFILEGLDVYKAMIKNNAYSVTENEYMQIPLYRNIVQICISLREATWFEFFIDNYSKCLHPEHREDLRNYSYAYLHFIRKDFDKSLVSVSKINQELFLFKPDLKNLMLILYYEVNYIEAAFSMVKSYKQFLSHTSELPNSFVENYTKFLNYYLQLLKIKINQSKEQPSYYKNKIEKEKQVVNKIWLLEKAEELIKRG